MIEGYPFQPLKLRLLPMKYLIAQGLVTCAITYLEFSPAINCSSELSFSAAVNSKSTARLTSLNCLSSFFLCCWAIRCLCLFVPFLSMDALQDWQYHWPLGMEVHGGLMQYVWYASSQPSHRTILSSSLSQKQALQRQDGQYQQDFFCCCRLAI